MVDIASDEGEDAAQTAQAAQVAPPVITPTLPPLPPSEPPINGDLGNIADRPVECTPEVNQRTCAPDWQNPVVPNGGEYAGLKIKTSLKQNESTTAGGALVIQQEGTIVVIGAEPFPIIAEFNVHGVRRRFRLKIDQVILDDPSRPVLQHRIFRSHFRPEVANRPSARVARSRSPARSVSETTIRFPRPQ